MRQLLKANFRKGRAGLIVMTIFILLAVFLLTVGLSLVVKVPSIYAAKIEETNSADFAMNFSVTTGSDFTDELIEDISALPYVKDREVWDAAIVAQETRLEIENFGSMDRLIFYNKDAQGSMLPEFNASARGEGIPLYMSSYYEIQNILYAGQKIYLKIHGVEYPCYLAGFYESVIYLYSGLIFTDAASYDLVKELQVEDQYTSEVKYRNLQIKFDGGYDFEKHSLISKDYGDIYERRRQEYIDKLQAESPVPIPEEIVEKIGVSCGWIGTDDIISSSQPYMLLISVMMIVFSFVLTAVALIIMNFLIRSGIEDDMRNIGILKGLGYTTSQLRGSYLILYGILIAVGAMLGMVVAVCIMPVFDTILAMVANFSVSVPANGYAAVGSLLLVTAIDVLVVWITTANLKGITPLFALRGAMSPHSFKKNSLPLDRAKGGLNVTLGLKSVFQNKRQSAMSFAIVLIMTFLSVFAFSMYYNTNVDKSAMLDLSGEVNYDINLRIELPEGATDEDYESIFDEIGALPQIEKMLYAQRIGAAGWLNGDISVSFKVADNYADYGANDVYEGRYPTLATECAISGDMAKALNIRIGDVLRLSLAKGNTDEIIEKDFTVVGLTQAMNTNRMISVTAEGYSSITTVDYKMPVGTRYIFYKDEYKNGAFTYDELSEAIDSVIAKRDFEGKVGIYINDQQQMIQEKVFKIISPASAMLMDIILVVTAVVIAAVVFMIIRMKMIREKKNIAISKALGYTSWQIMHQTGLSMLMIALPAAVIGGLLGGLLVNPLMNLVGGFIGLYKVGFIVHYGFIVLISLALAAINYLVALLVSLSTRLITPRMLVAD